LYYEAKFTTEARRTRRKTIEIRMKTIGNDVISALEEAFLLKMILREN
jgi:hypothetical protein